MDNSNTIGNRIRLLRELSNETQAELAKALKVKRETVNQWENETRDLKTQYTVMLADHFKTTCDYILRGIQAENVSIHTSTGLSDESIEILKKCYQDWPSNSITRTVNTLLQDKNVLYNIARYLFYKLRGNVVPFGLEYDLAKSDVFYADDGDGLKGHYVDSSVMYEAIDEGLFKKILLIAIQSDLENLTKKLNQIEDGEE